MRTMINALLTCALLCAAGLGHAQQVASGLVYLDANGNGKRDRQEKGLADVAVSNGREVVLTDAQGRYELPVGQDNILFVIKPSGYHLPLNARNLPQSYYIHKPQGSPAGLRYAGVPPTGPLPKSVDFPLTPANETETFRVLVFGDPQPYTEQELAFFNKGIVDEVVGTSGVAFGLSLGDLVGDDLSLHPGYKESVARIGLPWYNVKGNHDMNYDVQADSLSDETFEANFGPATYAFNYGKVHFIVLDNIRYPDPRDGQGYWGGFRPEQLDFVENDLKHVPKDHLVVLAFHIPLQHRDGDAFRPEDRQRLFDLLKDHPHTLSLSAHTHFQSQYFYNGVDGWKQDKPHHEYNVGTTSGDWYSGVSDERGVPETIMRDGTPNGFAWLDFDGNRYRIRYQVAGKPADYQINLFHPKVLAQGKRGRGAIFANFFLGHAGNTVEYRIDEHDWQRMTPTETADPAYLSKLYPWDHSEELLSGRRPSDAVPSTHLWRAPLPTDLPVGTHTVTVRAADDYGNTYLQSSTFRIEKPND